MAVLLVRKLFCLETQALNASLVLRSPAAVLHWARKKSRIKVLFFYQPHIGEYEESKKIIRSKQWEKSISKSERDITEYQRDRKYEDINQFDAKNFSPESSIQFSISVIQGKGFE